MCRPQKEPLRLLSAKEGYQLDSLNRSLTMPADQVIHAIEVLAVADVHAFTEAARFEGRAKRRCGRSSDCLLQRGRPPLYKDYKLLPARANLRGPTTPLSLHFLE